MEMVSEDNEGYFVARFRVTFPKPEPGMRRFVIDLEKKEGESNYRVELVPGRYEEVALLENHYIEGTLREEVLEGWGEKYYFFTMGPLCSTVEAVAPNLVPTRQFVRLVPSHYIRYTSRIPLVVYLPVGAELRYRVWALDSKEYKRAPMK